MEHRTHEVEGLQVVELIGNTVVLRSVQSALDMIASLGLFGGGKLIIHKEQIAPEFFDLSTRLAGDILQKFVTYQVRLAIVGDFTETSDSLSAFMYESNRQGHIFFLADTPAALQAFASGKA